MSIEADAEGMAVHCERTREELAVQALTAGRHGELDGCSTEHLDHCTDCATEQSLFAQVTQVLSSLGPHVFDGIPEPGPRRHRMR
ncbi:hypothetical protein [Streptomyces sp. WG7]|uniref:hypothetical protein n=1 Tax=Streptomyces sp. WG7 TaxID=3417650 RepID=UPI003CF764C1